MAWQIDWHVPTRIFFMKLIGDLTIDDLHRLVDEELDFIRNGDPPVHFIVDLREMGDYPISISELRRNLALYNEPNLGWLMTLSNDRMVQYLSRVVSTLQRNRYRHFNGPDELIEFIVRKDESLPEVPPYS